MAFGTGVGLAPYATGGLARGGWGRPWRAWFVGAVYALALLALALAPPLRAGLGFRSGVEWETFCVVAAAAAGLFAFLRGLVGIVR